MILTNCAACAAPLAHDHKKRCSRCKTRYCNEAYKDAGATLDDLREAVSTLEDTERIARRVLGGSNPLAIDIEKALRHARALLHARETPQPAEDRAEEVD